MNKAELVTLVAERLREPRAKADELVDGVFATIADALGRGQEVRLPAFGVFDVAETPARMGRNPQTGQEMAIPAGKKIRFRAGKGLRESL